MSKKENKQLARNYAQALSELAQNDISFLEESLNAIETINKSFKNVQASGLLFESPSVPIQEKKELIKKVTAKSALKPLNNFLLLLVDKQKFNLLPQIQEELAKVIDEKKGLVYAEVSSAIELNENTIKKIKDKLEKNILKENQKIKINNVVQKELIGGLKIKINDLVFDGSLRGKLENLKREIG